MKKAEEKIIKRPPVVVVMGHVDHGKSTLLDYIRSSNIVAGEAGGITQHLGAYEITHKTSEGDERKITFIDTPGHEAFSSMRSRGANVADIGILIIAADDGIKKQTKEAYETIKTANLPFVVAINKIDKPDANVDRIKTELMEMGVFLEGFGGTTPYAEISAKTGSGIDSLMDMIILTADLEDWKGDLGKKGEGVVIETNLDTKRGITAVLVVKDGKIEKGDYIVVGDAIAPTRIFEDTSGKQIKEARFSTPIKITGFDKEPEAGEIFETYENKKDAEKAAKENAENQTKSEGFEEKEGQYAIPIVIKTDVRGTCEAIEKKIKELEQDTVTYKIVHSGTGSINESDIKRFPAGEDGIIVGFNSKLDNAAKEALEGTKIDVQLFDIIYKLTEWLEEEMEKRRPRQEVEEIVGKVKIIKVFNQSKNKQVVGGKVIEGYIKSNSKIKIDRRENILGIGEIDKLEAARAKVGEVKEGTECGMMIDSRVEIAPGDVLVVTERKTI